MGTREGAVIMYDLKTASRLYVLEPHKHPVSAVMFSPDGRRLVTVSLEEGDITVWKVGSSLSGFFNVGGPPRQGGEKGEPFKRIEFARADDGTYGICSVRGLSDDADDQARSSRLLR
jgi:WD40 repeat protein